MKAKPLIPLVALAGFIGLGGLPCHWQAWPRAVPAAGAQATDVQEVHVSLGEWSLTPAHLSVLAGVPLRLVATNNGVLAHALAIEGDGLYAETDAIGSSQSANLEVTILPGLYDVFCPVAAGQHRALGQDGTLEAHDAPITADILPTDPADGDREAGVAPYESETPAAPG